MGACERLLLCSSGWRMRHPAEARMRASGQGRMRPCLIIDKRVKRG